MTPRSLFLIVLKCLGIFFIKDFLLILPQFLTIFYFFSEPGGIKIGILSLLANVMILAVYSLLFYYLIFNTEKVLHTLQLERGFDEQLLSFNIHRSSVLSIIIIITGLLVIVDAVPELCRQLYLYFQEKTMTYAQTKADISKALVAFVQLLVGLLLVGNQRQIVNFIERKRRVTAIQNEEQS